MPLRPDERAALALWLTAARTLDPDCIHHCGSNTLAIIGAARSSLTHAANTAPLYVTSSANIGPFIEEVSQQLQPFVADAPESGGEEIGRAAMLLQEIAAGIAVCSDGDGHALEESASDRSPPSTCGALQFAGIVERNVQKIFEYCGAPLRQWPIIYFSTYFSEASKLAPFRVNGEARINRIPRTVILLLHPEKITSRDLWHLAYTLHHELICHGLQGSHNSAPLPNAPQRCNWTEGWMDTVVHDVVLEWLASGLAPLAWLPLRGDEARATLWEFHDYRYQAPPNLIPAQVKLRRRTRDAYRALTATLTSMGIATSREEAERLSRRFSLAANVNADANWERLDGIASRLRIALLNKSRPELPIGAVNACLEFIGHNRMDMLEDALHQLVPL